MDFVHSVRLYRHELLAHCHRMLGSLDEAEDVLQETYLRAWRAFERFEGRSSVRSWLYRIATNACLSALDQASRRAFPSGLMTLADDPHAIPPAAGLDVSQIQPVPGAFFGPASEDPVDIVTARDDVRLALLASLQQLPSRQRAVLILREVLAFPAAEVAQMLNTSVPAVKSLLQRARATLEEAASTADHVIEPSDSRVRELLGRYMKAFETSDAAALQNILRDDVISEMGMAGTWFDGAKTCLPAVPTRMLGPPVGCRRPPAGGPQRPPMSPGATAAATRTGSSC
uniref:RNA polymerase subunit sigma-70 n=1 Tax=Nonomuraea bangladeshensis TaxID=404385 RepID=UPI003F497BA9